MTTQIKKVVMNARLLQPDHVAPNLRQQLLRSCLRSHKGMGSHTGGVERRKPRIIDFARRGAMELVYNDDSAAEADRRKLQLQISLNFVFFGEPSWSRLDVSDESHPFASVFPQDYGGLVHLATLHNGLFQRY